MNASSALRRAFTLVELLVVIAIIGILVALLLPAIQAAREAARRSQCVNNKHQIVTAMQLFHDANGHQPQYHAAFQATSSGSTDSRRPPAGGGTWTYSYTDPGPVWSVLILPFMEEQALFDEFDQTVHMSHTNNRILVQTIISTFVCPSAPSAGNPVFDDRNDVNNVNPKKALGLYYPVSMGPTEPDVCQYCPNGTNGSPSNWCCQGKGYGTGDYVSTGPGDSSTGVFGRHYRKRKFKQITDGLTHTFLTGESLPEQCVYQGAFAPNFSLAGTTIPLNTYEPPCLMPPSCHQVGCGFKSAHMGGAHFAMCDGSIHFVQETIDYKLYNELGTRAGAEVAVLP
jgi:prepilin-type N-terminal cleavage/methylation domain-containing protein